jgi:transcriptional regulator with XRE-family HTH domain
LTEFSGLRELSVKSDMPVGHGIGARIFKARKSAMIRSADLAKMVGVSHTALWKWERNQIIPRKETLSRLAQALGVSPEYLRTGAEAAAITEPLRRAQQEIADILAVPASWVKLTVEIRPE